MIVGSRLWPPISFPTSCLLKFISICYCHSIVQWLFVCLFLLQFSPIDRVSSISTIFQHALLRGLLCQFEPFLITEIVQRRFIWLTLLNRAFSKYVACDPDCVGWVTRKARTSYGICFRLVSSLLRGLSIPVRMRNVTHKATPTAV